MKKIISVFLILIIIFTSIFVTSCENKATKENNTKTDADLIVGSWEYDYDFGKTMADGMKKDENIGKFIPENVSFKVKLVFTFTSEGIMETGTKDGTEEAMDKFMIDLYTQVFTDYFEEMAKQNSMTTEELLRLLTSDFAEDIHIETIEDYVKYSFKQSDYKDTLPEAMADKKCKYSLVDGKMYTSESVDTEVSETEYVTYTISETELVFTGDHTGEDTENYPMTFVKVS